MKPWEKFQQEKSAKVAAPAEGPWSQFKSQPASEPDVIQEMHPEFTVVDRLAVKNLAENNEAAVNYLQKKHPDLQIKVDDVSGEIVARKRDGSEAAYRVLDPDTGIFSSPKEFGMDLADTISSVGQGAAAVGGSIAGAAGGPVGSITGGATTAATYNALKQRLAQELGLRDRLDAGETLREGVAGAIPTGVKASGPALRYGAELTQKVAPTVDFFAPGILTKTAQAGLKLGGSAAESIPAQLGANRAFNAWLEMNSRSDK